MGKKYVIFDFDGTLLNTNDVIVASWQAVFEKYLGHRLDILEIEARFGETLKRTVETMVPGEPVEEVMAYYRAYQNEHQKGMVYVYDGIRELLDELRKRGCLIGVATSRTLASYLGYMEQFGMEDSVDAAVTMDDVTRHKPDPETFTAVVAKLAGLEPDAEIPPEILAESIMIGDTKYDIGCANNAGAESVLVGWSHYIDEDDMAASGFVPTYRIEKPEDLLELI